MKRKKSVNGSRRTQTSTEKPRDWSHNRQMWIRLVEKQTGKDLDHWNSRIANEKFADEQKLTAWLAKQGVTGYAKQLLVMEQFGYPDFLNASAEELIHNQYVDRPHLLPIYEAIVAAAHDMGGVLVQARKGFVSLVTPRRTFARVQATTKSRVDLGLRLDGVKPGGRLQQSRIHDTMKLQMSFTKLEEVDAEALRWLKKAYDDNRGS
jgi:Domain of unknown function (DUF5655)